MRQYPLIFFFVFSPFIVGWAQAVPVHRVRMQCNQSAADPNGVQGDNGRELVGIASLSKIFTTDWVIDKKGAQARLLTRVVIQPLSAETADVHLLGSRDPSFGRTAMQLLVAGLKQKGIQKIHRLSFDQDFKYYDQPDSDSIAHDYFTDKDPTSERSIEELRLTLRTLSKGYASLRADLLRQGVQDLPRTLQIQVNSIVSSDSWDSVDNEQYYQMASPAMLALLRQMNAQSNNYFADQLFLGLGGADAVVTELQNHLHLDGSDVELWNGSGDRYAVEGSQESKYNSANCPAVLDALRGLRADLQAQDLDLSSVLPVVGLDTTSTVDVYASATTRRSVVAKSGTINMSVGLAGLASTHSGGMYFVSVLGPGLTPGERETDRADIQMDLEKAIEARGGPVALKTAKRLNWGHDAETLLQPITDENSPSSGIVWSSGSN